MLRAQRAESSVRMAGVLGARFPGVRQLKVHLAFFDRQRLLEERELSFGLRDAAAFHVDCPGRCGRGRFDLAEKIAEAAAQRLAVSDITLLCAEPLFSAKPEPCGCELKCRLESEFFPAAASAVPPPPQP